MGDGTYQVKPGEQVVFRSGRLAARDNEIPLGCGCPAPATREVLRAATPSVPPIPDEKLPPSSRLASPGETLQPVPPPVSARELNTRSQLPGQVTVSMAEPDMPPLPASKPNDVQVQIDAPFVFRAADPPPAPTPVAPILEARNLPLRAIPKETRAPLLELPPAQPPAQTKPPQRSFLGKVKGFFAAIFR
jgi:hypothetical protein